MACDLRIAPPRFLGADLDEFIGSLAILSALQQPRLFQL
jgi:hypothetical protein